MAGAVFVGDVKAVAVEGGQVVGADQVLGVPGRPDVPQSPSTSNASTA
jgi:hypothetical protein